MVIVLEVDGLQYPLSQSEARDLLRWLRDPNPHAPAADDGSIAAAVFLERLLEDPEAQNPPMNDEEARGIALALLRMSMDDGLTERQQTLHDAIVAHLVTR